MSGRPDVIVVGAGVVGAACARELAAEGLSVEVYDRDGVGAGATSAAMGHLVAIDGRELELSAASVELWRGLAGALSEDCGHVHSGTLWVAAGPREIAGLERRAAGYAARGVELEWLRGDALARREPALRPGLAGALRVPGDQLVYPPAAARWLLEQAMERGARVLLGRAVQAVDGRGVQLTGGAWRSAGQVVVAAGLGSRALLRPLLGVVPLAPRKGHLAVTARGPALCRHQLVEASYLDSVHGESGCSVAMNIQPRPGGQLLVGSSRQRGVSDLEVEPALLGRMLARACDFMPSLAERSVLRAWCGLRPATPDGLPLIGPVPSCHGLWLAAGHEGLGITTSLATAELITDQMLGRRGALDPAPYCLGRFEGREVA